MRSSCVFFPRLLETCVLKEQNQQSPDGRVCKRQRGARFASSSLRQLTRARALLLVSDNMWHCADCFLSLCAYPSFRTHGRRPSARLNTCEADIVSRKQALPLRCGHSKTRYAAIRKRPEERLFLAIFSRALCCFVEKDCPFFYLLPDVRFLVREPETGNIRTS